MNSKAFGLWTLGICPLVLVVAGIAYGFAREYRAWPGVRDQVIDSIQIQQRKYNEKLTERSQLTDSQKITQAKVGQLAIMARVLSDDVRRADLSTSADSIPDLRAPGTPWPSAPRAEQIVKDSEPFVDSLEVLLNANDVPVRGQSLVREAQLRNQLATILDLYFRYSFYNGDNDKAKRALTLLSRVVLGLDIDTHAAYQRNQLADINLVYELLSGSLLYDRWTEQDLSELSDVVLKPLDIAARLQEGHEHQPEFVLEMISQACIVKQSGIVDDPKRIHRTLGIDSVYFDRLLKASQRGDVVNGVDYFFNSILDRAKMIAPIVSPTGIFAVDVPFNGSDVDQFSVLLENAKLAFELGALEDIRRIVLVAVSVKRFELREKRWPSSLEEVGNGDELLNLQGIDGITMEQQVEQSETNHNASAAPGSAVVRYSSGKLSVVRYYPLQRWLLEYGRSPLSVVIE